METSDISTQITPSLHPDNLLKLEGYDETTAPYVAPVATAFSEAYEGIKSVWSAREAATKNPTWNEAQQIIQVDDFASKKLSRISKHFDSAMANLDKSIAAVESQLNEPLQQSGNSALASEIRNHVKGLTTEQRHHFLEGARKSNDSLTLSSVLSAPGYLSGIDETERKTRIRMYHESASPDVAKRLKVMIAAREMVNERGGLVFSQVEKAVGASTQKVKALREAKSKAEAAFVVRESL